MNRNPLDLTQAKILIVDDVPANIGTLRAPLETAGYQVLIATSGEDALEAVADLVPDLILLEAMMPGLDGWESTITSSTARCGKREGKLGLMLQLFFPVSALLQEGCKIHRNDAISRPTAIQLKRKPSTPTREGLGISKSGWSIRGWRGAGGRPSGRVKA